ncbi:MAG: hypothetical protein LCI00_16950 [Chloroflexi bacterium]|nr:hypothetical protein [Chloroflexota bacterium]
MNNKTWQKHEAVEGKMYEAVLYGVNQGEKPRYFKTLDLAKMWVEKVGMGGRELTWVQVPYSRWIAPSTNTSGWQIQEVVHVTAIEVCEYENDYRVMVAIGDSGTFPRLKRTVIDTIQAHPESEEPR